MTSYLRLSVIVSKRWEKCLLKTLEIWTKIGSIKWIKIETGAWKCTSKCSMLFKENFHRFAKSQAILFSFSAVYRTAFSVVSSCCSVIYSQINEFYVKSRVLYSFTLFSGHCPLDSVHSPVYSNFRLLNRCLKRPIWWMAWVRLLNAVNFVDVSEAFSLKVLGLYQ